MTGSSFWVDEQRAPTTRRMAVSNLKMPAFLIPSGLPASSSRICRTPFHRPPSACASSKASARPPSAEPSLYALLNLPSTPAPSTLSPRALHEAYISAARSAHPDTGGSAQAFAALADAWRVLGDERLRRAYDAAGMPAVAALESVARRAALAKDAFPEALDGEQMDFLSETGALATGLLSGGGEDEVLFQPEEGREDACPRSVEEAVWSIRKNPDRSVRYYALWWVYRFKVSAATAALVETLRTSRETTALGGYGLRRRAALALGAVASMGGPGKGTGPEDNQDAVFGALLEALGSEDYFLRYRAAEAIASIALREQRRRDAASATGGEDPVVDEPFPEAVLGAIVRLLWKGADALAEAEENKSGYDSQEGLFDLDHLEPEVAAKLRDLFEARRANEHRSRRTTMTPQLGVDAVDTEKDEPYEWLLKALAAGTALQQQQGGPDPADRDDLCKTVRAFLDHPFPLVRYAARKALYTLTGDKEHAEALSDALDYGIEHHYSQRVLIRDLGDLGYAPAAGAVAASPMVENSFKILALKSMLAKAHHDPNNADTRNVLSHMDSLL